MDSSTPLADMRVRHMQCGLLEADCAACPFAQFGAWLRAAQENSPGEWFEVNAMNLATSTQTGEVSARTVLLKGFDQSGLTFYTNYSSQKGRQLADNPVAAATFFWPHLERQVRISGTVQKTSRQDSQSYFHSRPRESQLGAIASQQSAVLSGREELEALFNAAEKRYEGAQAPLPDSWGGYLLKPDQFEFWQGRIGRLHDRIRYRLADGAWVMERLAP
ncbi:MAG: pyridoxamine 5'-phosphate oxidase [Planctomycetales bacterium]|nr:pyridoxamine 5'-phosphate oxidase [Planctomycetales bacterium]